MPLSEKVKRTQMRTCQNEYICGIGTKLMRNSRINIIHNLATPVINLSSIHLYQLCFYVFEKDPAFSKVHFLKQANND
jgi:hypothetical protein